MSALTSLKCIDLAQETDEILNQWEHTSNAIVCTLHSTETYVCTVEDIWTLDIKTDTCNFPLEVIQEFSPHTQNLFGAYFIKE